MDWLSNKCSALHEGSPQPASSTELSSAGPQLLALTLQPVDEAAHSPVVAELGWAAAIAVGAALAFGAARRPALRAVALVMDWSMRGDRLRLGPPAAAMAAAEQPNVAPGLAAQRQIEAPPRARALVKDGVVNELLDQLGLDEETANRALLRLYARGGWLKWEELLPPELPVEARDRLVKVCRMINGTLTLGEARAALAQAKLMLRAYDNAREPMAA